MTPHDLIAAFEVLAEAPEGVTRLRELVLQLAVRGKLVPQDPDDESAGKVLPAGRPGDVPHEVPPSWIWHRLDKIADYNGRPKVEPDDIAPSSWLLDLEDIEKGTSRLLRRTRFAERGSRSTKCTFLRGDVLFGKLRPYLDKVLVADEDGVCTTEIVPIVPGPTVSSAYLRLALKRPDFLALLRAKVTV